jgi:hypothetical protein
MTLNLKQLPKNRSGVQVPLVTSHFLVLENSGVEMFPSLLLLEKFTGRGLGGEVWATPMGELRRRPPHWYG